MGERSTPPSPYLVEPDPKSSILLPVPATSARARCPNAYNVVMRNRARVFAMAKPLLSSGPSGKARANVSYTSVRETVERRTRGTSHTTLPCARRPD